MSAFSGGWRVRLNLARALMTPSDLLLLDEPTNHLDLDAVLWLEQWLLKYPGTLLLISHDREFLDNVTTHTLHLHDGKAKLYTGDYTAFERQRAEQLRLQQITHEKEQAERAHLQSFIDRFKAKAAKAKQAQSRVKRLAKLAGTEAVRAERELRIDFAAAGASCRISLIRLNHVDAGYGERRGDPARRRLRPGGGRPHRPARPQRRRQVDAGEDPGRRTASRSPASAARIRTCASATSPSTRWNRCTKASRRSTICATCRRMRRTQAFRDFLGKWNFPGDRAFESVDGFSGGERARLALALIAWRSRTCCCSTNPPTTSTWKCAKRWPKR